MNHMDLSSSKLAGIAVLIVAVILITGFFLHGTMLAYWIVTAVLMILFLVTIGKAINGRWSGILIDELNVMRLSRLQIIIWTVIILSAYLTIATANIYARSPDPLAIKIDWQLWALLGISTTSLVGTPLIINDKKKKKIREEAIVRNNYEEISREGIAKKNLEESSAEFTDMFKGDEAGNGNSVDMSKVQMFFFTIISALSYIVLLFNSFLGNTLLTELPKLPDGLIAILTISHGAYLSYKIVDHTSGATKQV